MTSSNSRIVIVKVTPRVFADLFVTGQKHFHTEGLPADVQFRGFAHDFRDNTLNLFFEHPSFDQTPEGYVYPVREVKFTTGELNGK